MSSETFQPISIKPPSANPLGFALRCLFDLQLATVAQYLRPAMAALPKGDILDVGAGEAPWREWLPAGCRYVGLDVGHASDFGMAAKSDDIHLYDGGRMPFGDDSFDGLICTEVLEHASDPDELISEIARVLKDGAPLLLTAPWSARRHHIPHDYHRFTRERLIQLLETHGFKDIEVRERGDDVAVIANKMIVLTIGCVKRTRLANFIVFVPAAVIFGFMSAIMLVAAHLPRGLGLGSAADPLGYFCSAKKSAAK